MKKNKAIIFTAVTLAAFILNPTNKSLAAVSDYTENNEVVVENNDFSNSSTDVEVSNDNLENFSSDEIKSEQKDVETSQQEISTNEVSNDIKEDFTSNQTNVENDKKEFRNSISNTKKDVSVKEAENNSVKKAQAKTKVLTRSKRSIEEKIIKQKDVDNTSKIVEKNKKYYIYDGKELLRSRNYLMKDAIWNIDYRGVATPLKNAWVDIDNETYHTDEFGMIHKGLQKIGSYNYLFDEGILQTSKEVLFENRIYYCNYNGIADLRRNKWCYIDNKRYYTDLSGKIYDGIKSVDGRKYLFTENGVVDKGKLVYKNRFYIVDKKGPRYLRNKWGGIGKKSWFADKKGYILTGIHKVNKHKYLFTEDGIKGKGKYVYKNRFYIVDKKGPRYLRNKWGGIGKKSWFADKNGYILTGIHKVNKHKYLFTEDGIKGKGKHIYKGKFYIVDKKGPRLVKNSWAAIGKKSWYTDKKGNIIIGAKKIKGHTYVFTEDGILTSGYYKNSKGNVYRANDKGYAKYIGKAKVKSKKEELRMAKIKKMISWMEDRAGRFYYDMGAGRLGKNSADCSSAVFRAMIYAGILPKNQFIGNTETLFAIGDSGRYLKKIKASGVEFGDIFLSGVKGYSLGASGHTGFILDKYRIIHCNGRDDGISITQRKGRQGSGPFTYYRII
ncbi:MAG: peptidoglycan amidohydrolase family protein [Tissierellia bacterium]|nr:peptidoglycan amidohydrolase family protein [Tissierellia bacterium]